ncbi:CPBP family intramembrane glutamic endopeptidase [Bacillus solitudinis]|uniref:CPBP family intramembrane glutamic endopeptidase n=1 Tax=Bacillus solitudinis TaxID=2014074 RepID=UPI000C242D27|nr:CPBP family intramembrane glutamic endopeptidase [Bacillus solitudinis]
MKKQDVLANMSKRILYLNVYGSQALMLVIALIAGLFLFDEWAEFSKLWNWNDVNILLFGGTLALIVVSIDMVLAKWVPARMLEDGGINKKIFGSISIPHLVLLCIVVSVCEEILFRAVLQSAFGLVIASSFFAFIHFRYMKKPVLFLSVVMVSFFLGILFEWTGNIVVTIVAHFLIDFLLGLDLKKKSKRVRFEL